MPALTSAIAYRRKLYKIYPNRNLRKMPESLVPLVVERELVGICKQSMLALRQQLRQYVDELHAQATIDDLKPYILTAANEVCDERSAERAISSLNSIHLLIVILQLCDGYVNEMDGDDYEN